MAEQLQEGERFWLQGAGYWQRALRESAAIRGFFLRGLQRKKEEKNQSLEEEGD